MNRLAAATALIAASILAIGFTYLNGGALVTLRLGFVTLYRVHLTWVVYVSLIVGMGIMLVAGAHSDRRVRRILRDRLAAEDERERAQLFIDRNQQDLFEQPPTDPGAGASGGRRVPATVSIESLAPDADGEAHVGDPGALAARSEAARQDE